MMFVQVGRFIRTVNTGSCWPRLFGTMGDIEGRKVEGFGGGVEVILSD